MVDEQQTLVQDHSNQSPSVWHILTLTKVSTVSKNNLSNIINTGHTYTHQTATTYNLPHTTQSNSAVK